MFYSYYLHFLSGSVLAGSSSDTFKAGGFSIRCVAD
jgi:hypothetical protein